MKKMHNLWNQRSSWLHHMTSRLNLGPDPHQTHELKRMVAYARSSVDFLTKLILHDQIDNHNWEHLFRTPLNNYDAVILLHRDRLDFPQRLLFPFEMSQGKHVVQGNASTVFYPFLSLGDVQGNVHALKKKLMVNFDPVRCYVEDLKGQFDDTLNLWYDSVGGDAIGLTWEKPGSKDAIKEANQISKSSDSNQELQNGRIACKGQLLRWYEFRKRNCIDRKGIVTQNLVSSQFEKAILLLEHFEKLNLS